MTSTNNEFPAPEVQQLMEEQKFYSGDPEEDSLKFQNTAKNSGGQNVLVDIIKQLKPGVELYKIAMPSYVLQPISLLEKLSIYSTPSNYLASPKQFSANVKENKMIVLIGWLLSTWRSVPRNGIEEVKPYNPVLGEHFFCKWIHDPNDHSELCAEQVSHHPPISAVYMRNKKRNFVYKGWVYPKVSFSLNSFTTIMDGKFSVDWDGDSYTFKYPNVVASGVLLGSTVIRASESLTVTSKDFIAKIKFDKDSVVVGHIYNAKKEKVYSLKGNFTKSVLITHLPTQTKHELYDVTKIVKPARIVKPVFQQGEYESQRNWHKVTVNVKKQDFEEANKAKFVIEERERKLAAARKEKATPHVPKLFKKEGDDWVFIGESALEQEAATIPLNPTTPVTDHTS